MEKILERKSHNPDTDTSEIEREIDRLVYELYRIFEKERKIIEGGRI